MTDLGDALAGVVSDGSLLLAAAVAALVGLVSFASPCVLPLVPGYLAYVAGLAGGQATAAAPRDDAAAEVPAGPARSSLTTATPPAQRRRAVLFVLGFPAVFVSFGAALRWPGPPRAGVVPVLTRVMGAVTILMGLAFLGGVPWLQRERRLGRRPPAGLAGAPLLGIVFGLGWTPCLGPPLSAVNTLAYAEASAGRGAALGLAYCLGLGVPFILVALGAEQQVPAAAGGILGPQLHY